MANSGIFLSVFEDEVRQEENPMNKAPLYRPGGPNYERWCQYPFVLNSRDAAVIEILQKSNKPLTSREIKAQLPYTINGVRTSLYHLRKIGLVEKLEL